MNIVEILNIELCAKFMGIKVARWQSKRKGKVLVLGIACANDDGVIEWEDGIDWYFPNCNWNHLMLACKKWDNLPKPFLGNKKYEKLCDALDLVVTRYEPLPVFNQLVENIKWYNKQSK